MKITREGKKFVLASLLIAAAALNTGNNLLYLILSVMLSLSLLAVCILWTDLWRVSAEISLEGPVYAKDETGLKVRVKNGKPMPAYSLDILAADALSPGYCGIVSPHGQTDLQLRVRFDRRGLHSRRTFSVRSTFPFVLVESEKIMKVSGEVLVYPEMLDVSSLVSELSGGLGGGVTAPTPADENDLYSLRDFRYGDDRRRIHWKASAKTDGLVVRDYALGASRKVTILVDNLTEPVNRPSGWVREPTFPARAKRDDEAGDMRFEKVISLAASLARDFIEDGCLVRVLSCRKVVPFGSGAEHIFKVLDILALLGQEENWESALPDDREGLFIAVLKDEASGLSKFVGQGSKVVYASKV